VLNFLILEISPRLLSLKLISLPTGCLRKGRKGPFSGMKCRLLINIPTNQYCINTDKYA